MIVAICVFQFNLKIERIKTLLVAGDWHVRWSTKKTRVERQALEIGIERLLDVVLQEPDEIE